MAATVTPSRTPPAAPARHGPRRRGALSRFSAAHGLMVASGLLAFVLVAATLGQRDETVSVAVARSDIGPGQPVSSAQVRWAELPASSALAGELVAPELLKGSAWQASSAVPAGQPLRRGDLAPAGSDESLRSMSVPLAPEHAAGGDLRAGDRVDVIDVSDSVAFYVASGIEVARVAGRSSRGGLTAAERDYFVVVRVDAGQALAIAAAMGDGKIELVRSSGATPVPVAAPSGLPATGPASDPASPTPVAPQAAPEPAPAP